MNERGFVMTEQLVGAFLAILILGLATLLTRVSLRVKENAQYQDARLELEGLIVKNIDCSKLPTSCRIGRLLSIKAKNGRNFIERNGKTVLHGWGIKAKCTGKNGTFTIKTAKIDTKGRFVSDPFSRLPLDYNHPESEILTTKEICPNLRPTYAASKGIEMKIGPSCYVNQVSQLPCNPSPPPACDRSYFSISLSLDTFGGNDVTRESVFGQRLIRYCAKAQ